MNDIGYIKLYRKLRNSPLFTEKRVFSKFEAWIDFLLSCNYTPGRFLLGKEEIEVCAGSFVTSKMSLREKYSWSNTKLNNYLDYLAKRNMILSEKIGKGKESATKISLLNFTRYQGIFDEKNFKNTPKATQYKNIKNIKNTSSKESDNTALSPFGKYSSSHCSNEADESNTPPICGEGTMGSELTTSLFSFYKDKDGKEIDEELNSLLLDFIKMRDEIKAPLSSVGLKAILKILANYDSKTFKKMLTRSIENSWKGVFPLSSKGKGLVNDMQVRAKGYKEDREERYRNRLAKCNLDIDYNDIEPKDLYLSLLKIGEEERAKKIIDIGVINENLEERWTKTKRYKNDKIDIISYNFSYQVFWNLYKTHKDLDFAIGELTRILNNKEEYLFPNGVIVVVE